MPSINRLNVDLIFQEIEYYCNVQLSNTLSSICNSSEKKPSLKAGFFAAFEKNENVRNKWQERKDSHAENKLD